MGKKVKIVFLLVLLAIIFPLLSASIYSYGDEVKVGEQLTITQVCADATYINITSIQFPNGTRKTINEEMTKDGDFYWNFNEVNLQGRYDVRGISDGCQKEFAFYFYASNYGMNFQIQHSFFYIFILLILVITSYYSIKLLQYKNTNTSKQIFDLKKTNPFSYYLNISFKNNASVFGWFGIYLSIWLFVVILNLALFSFNLFNLSEITKNFVIIISYGFIPFVICCFIWLIVSIFQFVLGLRKYQFGGFKK